MECGVTYSIKVFDKEVVLFKKIYAKLIVLESFSLNSKDTKSFEDVFTFNDVVVHAIYKSWDDEIDCFDLKVKVAAGRWLARSSDSMVDEGSPNAMSRHV